MNKRYRKDRVDQRCKLWGEDYRTLLMATLIEQTTDEYVFDTEHPNWAYLVERYRNRPVMPTVRQVGSFTRALLTGTKVSPEVMRQRLAICNACPYQRTDNQGRTWCGMCGCRTSDDTRLLANLAAYEEDLPHWGCKHPNGSKWAKVVADGVGAVPQPAL